MSKKKTDKAPKSESLLVELLTEELPPKALSSVSQSFADGIFNGLERHQLKLRDLARRRVFATPRRLATLIPEVLGEAPDRASEVLGPSVKAPPQAVVGFARKHGVEIAALERRDTPRGAVFVARTTLKGAVLDSILADVVNDATQKLPIPKVMRWGEGEAQFVPPGHGFMGAASIRLTNADEYEARLLKDGRVIADFATRKSEIDKQLQVEAKRQNARLGEYQDLLEEVTALVEFPAVYVGEFDASFLEVPQECLILTMRQNQKYFPLFASGGKLLPKFLIVSNMRVDDPRPIVGGNERVVRPRLED